MLTQQELKDQLDYDPEIGIFTWRTNRHNGRQGVQAGTIKNGNNSYLIICIDQISYRAARLAWLYMTGEWPKNDIDHINHNSLDDRFINLRDATRQQNLMNRRMNQDNLAGYKGVSKTRNRWRARINHTYLGIFDTKEEAAEAYKKAEKELFGEFASHANA